MTIIAGIHIYLTQNPKQADEWFEKIHICRNCKNYTPDSLFDGTCSGYGDCEPYSPPFNVDFDNACECFWTDKVTEYWLQKLGQISMEYSGRWDEIRAFFAQEGLLNRKII